MRRRAIITIDCTQDSGHHRVRGRAEIGGSVSALSAGAYITTLYVMVDIVTGGWRAPPPPHPRQAGLIYPL